MVKTVKVLVHLDDNGNAAVGVLISEWQGAHRIDRRWSAARPVAHRLGAAPRGVPPEVWVARQALCELIDDQERAEASDGG